MINFGKKFSETIRRKSLLKKQIIQYRRKQEFLRKIQKNRKTSPWETIEKFLHGLEFFFMKKVPIHLNRCWKKSIIIIEKMTYWQLTGIVLTTIFLFGVLMPEPMVIPVQGATPKDWHEDSFWYAPWGESGVHKGIDIFAKRGKRVFSSTPGLVLYTGEVLTGGNIIYILGPHWKIHYYAHLQKTTVSMGKFLRAGDTIGTNGNTGNARGKQPHLHYSLVSLIPYFWNSDETEQGWKKVFYIDPNRRFLKIYNEKNRKKRFLKRQKKRFLANFSKK